MKIEKEYPVIKALPHPELHGAFMFWCPFCKKWHTHGIGEGHRCAHCHHKDSPFDKTGYIIKKMTKVELRRLYSTLKWLKELGDF